ncbi:sulfurtransferase [Microbulbifer sp. THAF38]|uniref:sulfurtransferase n=1 Tax=Microbulbifer sp. THAF38 TaxID=2587856 RepID=UPI0012A7DEC6|nr:sulfurtransferase [Microbulbifer sp. THAF38]QFT55075.1 3-mercaptopyruvate sulfurtransferase [Microbulbifer sp. THAF38]
MDRMHSASLIEVKDLQKQIDDEAVVILDCRYDLADKESGAQAYAAGHIPGAHYASLHRDLSAPTHQFGGRHPMPNSAQFQQFARKLGINTDTPVVVYDDNRLGFAARAWFLFYFFGHTNIQVLNGGLRAWLDAGLALESGESEAAPEGNFSARPKDNLLVHYETLKTSLGDAPWQLVDARDTDRFAGKHEPIDPIAGHIPSAINQPWREMTDEKGKVKSPAALQAIWDSHSDGRPILNYCGSGVTACVNYFAQQLAGRRDSLLYPGSWSDWCAHQRQSK